MFSPIGDCLERIDSAIVTNYRYRKVQEKFMGIKSAYRNKYVSKKNIKCSDC